MEVILNKIFLEKNQIRFGDLFISLNDYFNDHHIDYMKYHAYADPVGSCVSTMTMGIFACLKTYKGNPNQRDNTRKYILELSKLINNTDYTNKNKSILDNIASYFNSNETEEKDDFDKDKINNQSIPYIISQFFDNTKYSDFYYINKLVNKLIEGHEDYITQLTLVTLAFSMTLDDVESMPHLFSEFLIKLIEMNKLSDKFNFYDDGNCRKYITF
jgi:hypothetical protein